MFKKNVLLELDRENLIDYDRETESVTLSPLGGKRVEEEIIKDKSDSVSAPARKRRN